MNTTKKTFQLAGLFRKGFSNQRAPKPYYTARFLRLKENQKKFSCDDGVPIFLKKGLPDKLLYQLSWILTIIGMGMSTHVFYELMNPAENSK